MSKTVKTVAEKLDSETIWTSCYTCEVDTEHSILTRVTATLDHSFDPTFSITEWTVCETVQCQGCKEVSFRQILSDSEHTDTDPDTGHDIPVETVSFYPHRNAGRTTMEHAMLLPWGVDPIYRETHAAVCNRQPILAGIGLRSLIEAVCRDRGAEGNSLAERIDALVEIGLLTPDSASIIHQLREMGNEAAHEAVSHAEEQLVAALEVTEHLLKTVYVVPSLTEKLKR